MCCSGRSALGLDESALNHGIAVSVCKLGSVVQQLAPPSGISYSNGYTCSDKFWRSSCQSSTVQALAWCERFAYFMAVSGCILR
jgi:hypothetical protein